MSETYCSQRAQCLRLSECFFIFIVSDLGVTGAPFFAAVML